MSGAQFSRTSASFAFPKMWRCIRSSFIALPEKAVQKLWFKISLCNHDKAALIFTKKNLPPFCSPQIRIPRRAAKYASKKRGEKEAEGALGEVGEQEAQERDTNTTAA